MLNSYSLGSFLYLGPLILYVPHTEANNALGKTCALFLTQADGKEELTQAWVRGFADPGEAFCDLVLVLTKLRPRPTGERGRLIGSERSHQRLRLRSPRW